MLIGHYITKLMQDGRCAMPSKFRKEIGSSAIVARWYEGCLVVVSVDKWQELLQKLTGRSEVITAPVRETDRFILGSAFEISTDSQGRFIVPKSLRDYAKLQEEVTFVGLGDRVEIWNKAAWEEKEKLLSEKAGEMIEKIAESK
jgi:MraZ protein